MLDDEDEVPNTEAIYMHYELLTRDFEVANRRLGSAGSAKEQR
jgi:hypothetical protein